MTASSLHVSLPDELVGEILSPLLQVPDRLFSNTLNISPFATPSQSSSILLTVCKQWMRVATPLLYHVVVLRSKAQAQALEFALKQNPSLGQYIKKLRLEGGFGPSMYKILATAPNVTDLCLTLELWSTDTVSGLVKGLHLINPVNLILREGIWLGRHSKGAPDNNCTRLLTQALCSAIEGWHTLVRLLSNYQFPRALSEEYPENIRFSL